MAGFDTFFDPSSTRFVGSSGSSSSLMKHEIDYNPNIPISPVPRINERQVDPSKFRCDLTQKGGINIDEHIYYCKVADGTTYRSIDGRTWCAIGRRIVSETINTLQEIDGFLYAGTKEGVFVTKNGGRSWDEAGSELANTNITALHAFDGLLYAGTDKGEVYSYSKEGNIWAKIGSAGSGLSNKKILALNLNGKYLYAGTNSGLYKIELAGNNPFWTGPLDNSKNIDVVALYAIGRCLYIGSHGAGVLKLDEHSDRLDPFVDGLSNHNVNCLCSMGGELYAGTDEGGIFKFNQASSRWECIDKDEIFIKCDIKVLYSVGKDLYVGVTDKTKDKNMVYRWNIRGGWSPLSILGVEIYREKNKESSYKIVDLYPLILSASSANGHVYIGTSGYGVFKMRYKMEKEIESSCWHPWWYF